jgi:hypothetical protein
LGARGVVGEEAVEGSGGWVGEGLLRHSSGSVQDPCDCFLQDILSRSREAL